jgi:hypothetical protein
VKRTAATASDRGLQRPDNSSEFVDTRLRSAAYGAPLPNRGDAMRFVVLVAGATAVGALSTTVIHTTIPQITIPQAMIPSTASTFEAVRALGGNLADFKITDINPAKAYRDVIAKITSGEPQLSLPTAPVADLRPIDPSSIKTFKIDDKEIRRAIAAGINSQIDQNLRRMQDLQAYGRNPAVWHGAPPH